MEDDGTVIDDDDVVQELEKNTVVMVVNSQDSWKPPVDKSQEEQSMPLVNKNTAPVTEKGGNMRLEFKGGNLQLRKPTKLVNFELFILNIFISFVCS